MSAGTSLFREEAFQSRIRGFTNPVTIRGSLSVTAMTAGLLAILAALLIYAWATPYARKVLTSGFIAPRSGSIVVKAPATGRARLVVENGSRVRRGDLLAVIEDASGVGAAGSYAIRHASLIQQRALTDRRIDLYEGRITAAKSSYASRIESTRRRAKTRRRISELMRAEAAIAGRSRDRTAHLAARRLAPKAKLEDADNAVLTATQRLIDAEAGALDASREIETLEIEQRIELSKLEEELLRLRGERLTLDDEIRRLEAERERDIHAPIDGVVTLANTRDSERVSAEQPLLRIDPTNEDYVATLLAPSAAIGFVALGDRVSIRYEAYPFREHGVFAGKVIGIDNAAQLPSEIGAPIKGADPVYRVTALIDQSPISKRGETLRLVSGMMLEASIVADEKPILFWLLDPVL
jgi:membrane fusion protein